MSRTIVRLVTKPARARLVAVQEARRAIAALEPGVAPQYALSALDNALWLAEQVAAEDAQEGRREFLMLSTREVGKVWDAIRALPGAKRPGHVRHAFDLALQHVRFDTGEILLTLDEIAEKMSVRPDKVTRAMGVLAEWGVIERKRVRIPGVRGPGRVVYSINPHFAWKGEGWQQARQVSQPGPLLTIMEGGKV
jgi:hypothetical protein